MTHEEYGQLITDGKLKKEPSTLEELGIAAPETKPQSRPGYSFDDFLPFLFPLLSPKQHLTSAPTFVPQSLLESIQLFDDGVSKKLYLYLNGAWVSCTLT